MLDDRREDRRRPLLAFGPEGVRAFLHAPAVVAAALDLVDHLPQVLADLAAPQVPGLAVEAELPRLPQAVGVDLRPGPFGLDEGVVFGNGVSEAAVGPVDVDTQDAAEQVADVLAGLQLVGDTAAVAGADVEVAVRPEAEAAAVVAARGPFDDHLLAGNVGPGRVARGGESRDPRPLGLVLRRID